jgi:cytochrome c oxidase subunit 3/cytochrome o ubiquinol oxidase subunit 3
MTFIAGQVFEFSEFFHKGLALQTNLFGCSFYVLTGFHGTHVTVGVIWLWSLWAMAMRGKLPASRALDVEIGGLYWHFVDVVWIAIFTLIYLIQ